MLFEEYLITCKKKVATKVSDGQGGQITTWTDGDEFKAAIVPSSAQRIRIGDKDEFKPVYQVFIPDGTVLDFHEVFQAEGGKVYRVLTGCNTNHLNSTPASATFRLSFAEAEGWSL